MAKLTKDVQRAIVTALACFDTPSEVAALVKERFALDIARQQVERYDPTKVASRDGLAKEWKALFEVTRKQFLEDLATIAVSHKAFRLTRLERMARAAEKKGNYKLAADLYRQAAEDDGDVYTNRRKVDASVGVSIDDLLLDDADDDR